MIPRGGRSILLLLLVACSLSAPAAAQDSGRVATCLVGERRIPDPLFGLSLWAGLDAFADRINGLINTAGTNGKLVAIEAGKQLWLTIYNAKLAYADEREKTFCQLNQTIQGNLQTIFSAVQTFERDGFAKSREILEQAQQVANTLPFSNKDPQVRGYSPYFVVTPGDTPVAKGVSFTAKDFENIPAGDRGPGSGRALPPKHGSTRVDPPNATESTGSRAPGRPGARLGTEPVRVEVNGNFLGASAKGMTPVLTIGSKPDTIVPEVLTDQRLVFLLPVSTLAPADPGHAKYTTANLSLYYKTGFIFKKRNEMKYRLLFTTLPPSPGTLEIVGQVPTAVREWREQNGPEFKQHSNDDDWDLVHCGSAPLDNWIVDPNSPSFVVHWSQGNNPDDWRYYFVAANPQVCYRVQTVHRNFGTSGKVNFHFNWKEYRDRTIDTPKTDTLPIAFGESKVYQYVPGKWKIVFKSFDGQKQEFSNVMGPQNRFLRLNATPTDVTVFVPRAEELPW